MKEPTVLGVPVSSSIDNGSVAEIPFAGYAQLGRLSESPGGSAPAVIEAVTVNVPEMVTVLTPVNSVRFVPKLYEPSSTDWLLLLTKLVMRGPKGLVGLPFGGPDRSNRLLNGRQDVVLVCPRRVIEDPRRTLKSRDTFHMVRMFRFTFVSDSP